MFERFYFSFLFIGIVTILYLINFYKKRYRIKVPGPFGVPLFGNFFQIYSRRYDSWDYFYELHKQFGKFFVVNFPLSPPFLFVSDPETLEYILKTNFENYVKGPHTHQIFYDFLGNGIFNADGHQWKLQRQTASHLFSIKELKIYVDLFVEKVQTVKEILQIQLSDEENRKVVDIQDILQRFTLDSIGKIAFGVEIGSLKKDNQFSTAFDIANEATTNRFYNPFAMKSPNFFYSEKELKKSIKIINQFSYEIIKKRKSDPDINQRTDLLSRYITMKDDEGKTFSDLYLRDIVINFILAGRDTTSQLLIWCLYLLSKNPEKEAKLVEEIEVTLNGVSPTFENTKNMKYLKAVLDETLRLYPPVPLEKKSTLNDDNLPNGIFIPKGTDIMWNLYGMGRMEEFYEDPLSFKPERWVETEPKKVPIKSNAFIPFLFGPRTCLGQKMAYTQAKVVLCSLLQDFRFQHVTGHIAMYDSTFVTLRAKYGMHMYILSRK